MRRAIACCLLSGWMFAAPALAQQFAEDASVTVRRPSVNAVAEGKHVVEEVVLATSVANYDLRYEIVELKDRPGRVGFKKWAASIGYTPLGICGPCMANWYNQGFFIWTFDGLNIQDYRAKFRVVREYGRDAMVEYVWDTPKAKVTARFAMTSCSDKLLMFGRYEPKQEIKEVKLRFMAYPATFDKPWHRTLTTALRTLKDGVADIDLEKERWLLLEDVHPDRAGGGSAGLLLGDAHAFSKVSVSGMGDYGVFVDVTMAPDKRQFALGFYEYPGIPDYKATRAYFKRLADAESDALAELASADLDKPLAPLPVDAGRVQQVLRADEEKLDRPAETWRSRTDPLDFPWASRLPGPPVRAAVLVARWAAFDTMELARRLEMDVKHQYFDNSSVIANASSWPYRNQTGIGSLGQGVATRNALRICTDDSRDVILVAALSGNTIGARLRAAILGQVRKGKGLVLTGAGALAGWPKELTAHPDDALAAEVLGRIPWESLPGLQPNGRGRIGDGTLLKAYRFGEGRVLVFQANTGRYQSLLPLNNAVEGLDGADDRVFALHATAFLAAVGRPMPVRIEFGKPARGITAGKPSELPVKISGTDFASSLVRIQDDHDVVIALGKNLLDKSASRIRIPPLPAMRRYYVDVALRNAAGECVGCGSTVLDVAPVHTIDKVTLLPSRLVHEAAVPMVDLPQGGIMRCEGAVSPAPRQSDLQVLWQVHDCFGRLVAVEKTPVSTKGVFDARLAVLPPVAVPHRLDVTLLCGQTPIAVKRTRFTIPVAYPYDDFTILMWSYARGELAVRLENRLCYDMGADMMDICHMRNYADEAAAREYAVASDSGLRLVPYVTRVAGTAHEDNTLSPGLFNEEWIEEQRDSMQKCCRQAAPYAPAAYTLGDENYLARGRYEVEVSPESTAAFRKWLARRYGDIAALNAVWKTSYAGFDEIAKPMLIDEAAQQAESFAAWLDFREFMDTAFADLHERLAGFVRKEDPGAKVGWDGLLSYHWQAGYDFHKLTRNLELNQVYTSHPLQAELVRSFKRPDALTGEWGNAIADKEDGFSAIIWHNLFKGHNSCWWWTSWGCDYIPFNPDLSVSHMGRWFYRQVREVKSGPGRLLVHAARDDSRIGILYSHADMFAWTLAQRMAGDKAWPSGLSWLNDLRGLCRALEDMGLQYRFVASAQIEEDPKVLKQFKVLVLPYATCLSDRQAQVIRDYVKGGGLLAADGRAGILTGKGVVRDKCALDDVFGVKSLSGLAAFKQAPAAMSVDVYGYALDFYVLEPGLKATSGYEMEVVNGAPLLVSNGFGSGRTMLLNVPFAAYNALRDESEVSVALDPISMALTLAGVRPRCRLYSSTGSPRRIEQSLFVDGDLRYLCLEQDILTRGLGEQKCNLSIDRPAYVYDVRAGKQIGSEKTVNWDVVLSRGRPLMFALMPYRVTGLDIEAQKEIAPGDCLQVRVAVRTDGAEAQYHVVHVDVYAPGAEQPHRQYSRNIPCPGGSGRALIPFAINDPAGAWRLEFKDAATGVKAEMRVRVQ